MSKSPAPLKAALALFEKVKGPSGLLDVPTA